MIILVLTDYRTSNSFIIIIFFRSPTFSITLEKPNIGCTKITNNLSTLLSLCLNQDNREPDKTD
jgi:hypothetical protein